MTRQPPHLRLVPKHDRSQYRRNKEGVRIQSHCSCGRSYGFVHPDDRELYDELRERGRLMRRLRELEARERAINKQRHMFVCGMLLGSALVLLFLVLMHAWLS